MFQSGRLPFGSNNCLPGKSSGEGRHSWSEMACEELSELHFGYSRAPGAARRVGVVVSTPGVRRLDYRRLQFQYFSYANVAEA